MRVNVIVCLFICFGQKKRLLTRQEEKCAPKINCCLYTDVYTFHFRMCNDRYTYARAQVGVIDIRLTWLWLGYFLSYANLKIQPIDSHQK